MNYPLFLKRAAKIRTFFLSSKFFCNIFSKKTTNRVFHLPEIGLFLLRISERASSSVKRLSDLRRDTERQKRLKNKKMTDQPTNTLICHNENSMIKTLFYVHVRNLGISLKHEQFRFRTGFCHYLFKLPDEIRILL